MLAPDRRIAQRAALLVLLLTACGDATGLDLEHAAARARWEQRGPESYTFTVSRSCECLPEMSGPVVVTVTADVVEARHYANSGESVAAEYAHLFPSVDGLFDRIESAARDKVPRLDVSYDPTFGYPVRIAIDEDEVMGNDEITYYARDLEAR